MALFGFLRSALPLTESMFAILTVLVFVFHALALRPLARRLAAGETPSTVDFACASVVLYYDLGLVIELLGLHDDRYFMPFFTRPAHIVGYSLLFLLVAPVLFRIGEAIVWFGRSRAMLERWSRIQPSRLSLFYAIAVAVSLPTALYGAYTLARNPAIWVARAEIGKGLGPLIIVLYIPLFTIAFFVRQRQAQSRRGMLFLGVMVVLAVMSTLAIGQRTLLLLPLLLPLAFRTRLSYRRVASLAIVGLVVASLVLPLFKWQFAGGHRSVRELVLDTVQADFSRSSALASALELSPVAGTTVLRYPFEGYVYSALFFVPRGLIPWKGQSTPIYFTAEMTRAVVEDTNWVFGIGVIEAAALNGGLVAVMPMLLLAGIALALLDRAAARIPGMFVPARFIGFWICTYDVSALVLLFGGMIAFCVLAHALFVSSSGLSFVPRRSSSGDLSVSPV